MAVRLLWKEKEKAKAVQTDKLRGLLGIRRMDRVPDAWIRIMFGLTKSIDEMTYICILQWFSHVVRMEMIGVRRVSM